jgi:hypothetical protein
VKFSFPGNALRISTHLTVCQRNKSLNQCDAHNFPNLA